MDERRQNERGGMLGWVARHPKLTAAILFFLFAACAVAVLDWSAGSRVRKRLDAIRARGEPVSVEDLNREAEALRGAGQAGAAERLVGLAKEIEKIVILDEEKPVLPYLGWPDLPGVGRRLPEEQLRAVEAYLARVAGPLEEARMLLRSEPECIGRSWSSPMIHMSMPELSAMRTVSRTLYMASVAAANESDYSKLMQDLGPMSRLPAALRCNTTVISALTRVGQLENVRSSIASALNLQVWTREEIEEWDLLLKGLRDRVDLNRALMTERVMCMDALGWNRSSHSGAAVNRGRPLIGPYEYVPLLPDLDAAKGLEIWAFLIEGTARPNGAAIRAAVECDVRHSQLPWYCMFTKMAMPSLSRSVTSWVRDTAHQEGLEMAIACERYRLDHGDWPTGLEVLKSEYVETIPVDPIDGNPIRFARIPEGVCVWSIGADEIDQGGDVGRLSPDRNRRPADDGWIVLDPSLRGREAEATTNPSGGAADGNGRNKR